MKIFSYLDLFSYKIMYKTASKFLQGLFSRRRNLPGLYPSFSKGTGLPKRTTTPPICPYCKKSIETTYKYHFKMVCATLSKSRNKVVKLQKLALADGNQWVDYTCIKCRKPIHIHVDWKEPQVICNDCKMRISKYNKNTVKVKRKQQDIEENSTVCPDAVSPLFSFRMGNLIPEKTKQHLNIKRRPKS